MNACIRCNRSASSPALTLAMLYRVYFAFLVLGGCQEQSAADDTSLSDASDAQQSDAQQSDAQQSDAGSSDAVSPREDVALSREDSGADVAEPLDATRDIHVVVDPSIDPDHLLYMPNAFEWVEIPDTLLVDRLPPESFGPPVTYPGSVRMSPGPMFGAWNGAAWFEAGSEMHGIANGGHADYCGNEHVKFDLDTLEWTVLRGPTTDFTEWDHSNAAVSMADGRPTSRHTYGGQVYLPSLDMFLLAGGSLCSGAGTMANDRWLVSRDGQTTTLVAGDTHWSVGMHLEYDPITEHAYLGWAGTWYRFEDDTYALTNLTPTQGSVTTWSFGTSIDAGRRKILGIGGGRTQVFDIDDETVVSVTNNPGMEMIRDCVGPGLEYVEPLDVHVAWCGDDLYFIDPVTFEVTARAVTGSVPTKSSNGVYGRFRYSQKYRGLVVAGTTSENVRFMRLAP